MTEAAGRAGAAGPDSHLAAAGPSLASMTRASPRLTPPQDRTDKRGSRVKMKPNYVKVIHAAGQERQERREGQDEAKLCLAGYASENEARGC